MLYKYKVTIPSIPDSAILIAYEGTTGQMKKLDIDCTLTEEQFAWLIARLPVRQTDITALVEMSKGKIKVEQIPNDLSFEVFWNAYRNKVGDKAKAEKLWQALNDAARVEVLDSLKKYETYLSKTKVAKVYPERYLSQQRWKNTFD
jgi:hypothetical protein